MTHLLKLLQIILIIQLQLHIERLLLGEHALMQTEHLALSHGLHLRQLLDLSYGILKRRLQVHDLEARIVDLLLGHLSLTIQDLLGRHLLLRLGSRFRRRLAKRRIMWRPLE